MNKEKENKGIEKPSTTEKIIVFSVLILFMFGIFWAVSIALQG